MSRGGLHLANGDGPQPPLIPGSLRIYNMRFCPFGQRAVLCATHKGIKFDVVHINLKNKPDWFVALARPGNATVPQLQRSDGCTMGESLITMEYIATAYMYDGPALVPSDPWQRFHDKVIAEEWGKNVIPTIFKLLRGGTDHDMEKLNTGFASAEKDLKERGSKFFFGAGPGLLDFAVWPMLERLPAFNKLAQRELFDGKKFPLLAAWMSSMLLHPTVQKALVPMEENTAFYETFAAGNPVYDP